MRKGRLSSDAAIVGNYLVWLVYVDLVIVLSLTVAGTFYDFLFEPNHGFLRLNLCYEASRYIQDGIYPY